MKKLLALLFIVLFNFSLIGQDSSSVYLSRKDFTDKCLVISKKLHNDQLEIQKNQVQQKRLKRVYIPTLTFTGSYGYFETYAKFDMDQAIINTPILGLPLPIFNGDIETPVNSMFLGGSLNASWVLFTGLKVPYLKKALSHKSRAVEEMMEKDRQDEIAEILNYYDKMALLKQSKILLDDSQNRLDKEKATAQKALKEGLITATDYNKIKLAELKIKSKYIEYEGKKNLLLSKLNQLSGISIDSLNNLDFKLQPWFYANGEKTYHDRGEARALSEAITATEYKVKSENSRILPEVAAFASTGYHGLHNGNVGDLGLKEISFGSTNIVGIGVKWDLIGGNTGIEEKEIAKLELIQLQNKKDEALELLYLNYENCKSEYNVKTSILSLKEEEVNTAKRDMEQEYKQFRLGLIRIADYLEAVTNYEKYKLDYYQAIVDQRMAAMEFLKSTGSLTPENIQ
jgi:outer membrane protein TolC